MQVALFDQVQNVFNHSACAICRDPFEINQRVAKLACDHLFHENCLLEEAERCPLCNRQFRSRRDVVENKILLFATRFFFVLSDSVKDKIINEIHSLSMDSLELYLQKIECSNEGEEKWDVLIDHVLSQIAENYYFSTPTKEQIAQKIEQFQTSLGLAKFDSVADRFLTRLKGRIIEGNDIENFFILRRVDRINNLTDCFMIGSFIILICGFHLFIATALLSQNFLIPKKDFK